MNSQQGKFMLQNLSDVFTQDPSSNLAQLLNAIGGQLDKIDPVQLGLALQRSISTATGSYLDTMGQDWAVTRRYQETDNSYRSRILAALPIYMSGPTNAAMASVVAAFVGGVTPIIIEYGPDNFIMGISKMGQFVFMAAPDPFTFQVQVQNPASKNLLPAFNDGWTINANAVVNDYYSLTLNATGNYQSSSYTIPVMPNTTYTFSATQQTGNDYYLLNGYSTYGYKGKVTYTFKTGPTDTSIIIYTENNGAGTFTFTNPQFELGNAATSFVQKYNYYKKSDMEAAVNKAKPARSTATFIHKGGV